MAIVREQAWIRELHASFPHGYNIEVHFPNEKTVQHTRKENAVVNQKKKPDSSGWHHISARGIPIPFILNLNLNLISASTLTPANCTSVQSLLNLLLFTGTWRSSSKWMTTQQNELLDSLSLSKLHRLQNWLTANQPLEDGMVHRIFQQLILTLESHEKKDQSHQSQGIFQSYDSTTVTEQEKKLRKKATANSVQWLKIPWRRNEMQHISIHTLINGP